MNIKDDRTETGVSQVEENHNISDKDNVEELGASKLIKTNGGSTRSFNHMFCTRTQSKNTVISLQQDANDRHRKLRSSLLQSIYRTFPQEPDA